MPCLRSLTCKSHSLTSKRKVQGRSRLFDELLRERTIAINKKNSERIEILTSQPQNENFQSAIKRASDYFDQAQRNEKIVPAEFSFMIKLRNFYLKRPLLDHM